MQPSGSKIFAHMAKHIVLDRAEKNFLTSLFSVREVKKKDLLLTQGQFCRQLFYVDSGSIRAYNVSKEGKEATVMFAVQDWWITDMYGFLNQREALLSLEALENSRLVVLTHESFERALDAVPKMERFFRLLFQNAYVREQLRALDNISLTTEERYRNFVAKYPRIVEKVTQKQIASYLGVTPEFLSTVKKK